MTDYCVQGYAFSNDLSQVVMIRKLRPAAIAGLLAGPGGVVEQYDEDIYAAMAREYEEETGVQSKPEDWHYLGQVTVTNGRRVAMFCAFNDNFLKVTTKTDEQVFVLSTASLMQQNDVVSEFSTIVSKSSEPTHPKTARKDFSAPYPLMECA